MENNDLLDLCRLNLMNEKVQDNSLIDKTEKKDALKGIKHKKRALARKIIENAPKLTEKQVQKHVKKFTMNGHYPPTFEDLNEEWCYEKEPQD